MIDALFMSGNTITSMVKGLIPMSELLFREYILKDYTWRRLCQRDQTNWKPLGRVLHAICHEECLWFM